MFIDLATNPRQRLIAATRIAASTFGPQTTFRTRLRRLWQGWTTMTVCAWCQAIIGPPRLLVYHSAISHGLCNCCAKDVRAGLPTMAQSLSSGSAPVSASASPRESRPRTLPWHGSE